MSAHIAGIAPSATGINTPTSTSSRIFNLVGTSDTGNVVNLKKFSNITADPSTSTITATNFDGLIKTVNTTAATAHFLNFSDSAGTGFGHPQKVSTVSVIPNTGIITANGLSNTTALRLNNTSTGEISIGFTGSGGTNVVNVNNGAASTGSINIGNGTGTSTQTINIGRNNALQILNGSGSTSTLITGGGINLVGGVRLNAQGSTSNTVSIASQGDMNSSAFIEIGAGSSSAQPISIGNGATASGTITIGGNNGIGLTGGKSLVLGARSVQIGTTGSTTINIRQNTLSLPAGSLGYTVRTTINTTSFTTGISSNNFQQMGTITAPAYGVYLISATCTWSNLEAVAAIKFGAVISETTATGLASTVGAGFTFWQETDTGSNILLQAHETLSGVFINDTGTDKTLYLNASYNQPYTSLPATFAGSTSITKIG